VLCANVAKEGLLRRLKTVIKKGPFRLRSLFKMSELSDTRFGNVLDPMERISETLFGLIMALTFICSLGVATGTNINIQTMLIGALGCNLAWGIVDGGLYLLARINNRGDKILTLRAIRQAPDPETARRVIADALPPELATILPPDQLELVRQKLRHLPEPPPGPGLTKRDWTGALGLCLLSFLSTFPVVIPFLFLGDARLALRVSYAVAIVMHSEFTAGCGPGPRVFRW
jgi:hypothetical protein